MAFDRSRGEGFGTGARDWRRIVERMNWATTMLRTRIQDASLLWPPFRDEDAERIMKGRLPLHPGNPTDFDVLGPLEGFSYLSGGGSAAFGDGGPPMKSTGARPRRCSTASGSSATRAAARSTPPAVARRRGSSPAAPGTAPPRWTVRLVAGARPSATPTTTCSTSTTAYGANPGRMIVRARDLFVRYGDEISAALLLSALPESYAAEWGAPVLIAHGDLVWQLPRRIRQTALFLLGVLTDTGPSVRVRDPSRAVGRGDRVHVLRSRGARPVDQHRVDALPAVRLAAPLPRRHPSGPRRRQSTAQPATRGGTSRRPCR